MKQVRPGAQGYSAEAPELLKQYEMRRFEDSHGDILDLIAPAPLKVLDIGAGTGRDAAWFAGRGDDVAAIEPTTELRQGAMALHPSPRIDWIDDFLPELASVRGRKFDLVWLSAVWMHFDAAERAATFPKLGALVGKGGALMLLLRHGPVPAGRRMFEVSAEETVALARQNGLFCVRVIAGKPEQRPGVSWTRLWFARP
jgi:SAM-dependent methyltransferase